MSLRDFLQKQFIDVIQWTESEDGVLAWRFPMRDMEIQNGGKLTVRESQLAVFVNEGPHCRRLHARALHADDPHPAPAHQLDELGQRVPVAVQVGRLLLLGACAGRSALGHRHAITVRDPEFGAVRLRAYGIYAYHISDARVFYNKVSGTREIYRVDEIEGQLRNTILGRIADTFASSKIPFLDMAANQVALGEKITDLMKPGFAQFGLALDSFVVESLSLPDELQKILDSGSAWA